MVSAGSVRHRNVTLDAVDVGDESEVRLEATGREEFRKERQEEPLVEIVVYFTAVYALRQ